MISATAGAYVLSFEQGDGEDAALLGGKGAGLTRLVALGLPVPAGFIVSCRTGRDYLRNGRIDAAVLAQIDAHLARLEHETGRGLGDPERPLLLSVRSGAPVSMPGMMDTVLNVGLTRASVEGLAIETSDEDFAWACYARLAESYARIVRGIPDDVVEDRLLDVGAAGGRDASRTVVESMQELMTDSAAGPMPDDAGAQVLEAAAAVFASWLSPRAEAYRRFKGIDADLGTAAVVQAMVFGNRGDMSGSGVAFTRDPSTGAPGAYGDFLFRAQGEDVVAGTHDPGTLAELAEKLPGTALELERVLQIIERNALDLSEVEFTVEEGRLWILQTRAAQRSGAAAVRTAVDMVDEGLIGAEEALARVSPGQVEAAAAPDFAQASADADVVARGLAASPGAAVGRLIASIERAVELSQAGEDVILIRSTTSPADVEGFIAARGVITGRGGRTSHAAVVARGMGRPAVCGVGAVETGSDGAIRIRGRAIDEGTVVSLDGRRGIVSLGALPFGERGTDPRLQRLREWCIPQVRVPYLPVDDAVAAIDAGHEPHVLVLDDSRGLSASAANARIAAANADGVSPTLIVTPRWAQGADRALTGTCTAIGFTGDVISAPFLARLLRAHGELG